MKGRREEKGVSTVVQATATGREERLCHGGKGLEERRERRRVGKKEKE